MRVLLYISLFIFLFRHQRLSAIHDSTAVRKMNSIFVEVGGRTLLSTCGYERIIVFGKRFNLGVSGGLSYSIDKSINLPVSIEANFGTLKNQMNLFLCAVNNFQALPSRKYFQEKKLAKSEGRECPPEFFPAYRNNYSCGVGYKHRIKDTNLYFEIFSMVYSEFWKDKDYILNKCNRYFSIMPWAGIKFNYNL